MSTQDGRTPDQAKHTSDKDLESQFRSKTNPGDTLTAVNSTSSHTQTETEKPSTATNEDSNVVFWDGPNDPENPMNWSPKLKVINVVIVSTWTLLTPLASSMVAPGTLDILTDFNSTNITLGSFIVSIYILGYAIGPLFIAPMSELYGRLPIYHACNGLFVVWSLACAFAPNLGSLLAFRFFQGAFGVCPLTIGSGTISDLIPTEKRGKFMSVYSIGPLLGPVIGPIAGAYLVQGAGWRWVFRVLTIASGVMTVFTVLTMRESYAPVVLRRRVQRMKKETGNDKLRSKLDSGLPPREVFLRAIVRPTKMLIFSPIVFLLSLYMAVVYGYLYLLFTTITSLFEQSYGFSQGAAGLAYLGIGIGMMLGLFVFGATSDKVVTYLANKNGGERKPEYRFPHMMIGAAMIPIGLFWYGWSAEYRIHYIMPIIGTGWVGAGLLAVFMPVGTYLVDAFTVYAASAMAANTVLRSLMGAFLPLAGPGMYKALGLGWGNSLLAFIAIALWPVSLMFFKYGERIRKSQRFRIEF
ncbi:hypothetical protein PMZ80_005621 [Knufia obscura]|uniref:Major facilitator superfamily (MFS) profile domain-containing protein n=1 Tax=Knufia obscura TaxID=1635080 RepID=A0ABR0RM28_9EURO|nr:hypothetical protein PMZ80_005621 [Knufia obscura]